MHLWEFCLSLSFLEKGLLQILFDEKSWEENCMKPSVFRNQERRFYFVFKGILWLWNQHVVIWGWFSSWPLNTWKALLLTLYFLCLPCITVTYPPRAQRELQRSHRSRIQSIFTWILCCRYFSVPILWTLGIHKPETWCKSVLFLVPFSILISSHINI